MVDAANSTHVSKLLVVRKSPRDVQHREVHVFVDGERVGVLAYGRKIERPLAPGRRTLKVYNTLVSKTLELDVEPGRTYAFAAGNEAAGCLMGWLMLVGAGPMSVFLEPLEEPVGEQPEAAHAVGLPPSSESGQRGGVALNPDRPRSDSPRRAP